MKKWFWLALLVGGCSLITSGTFDYSFDPQQFSQTLGDTMSPQTVPKVACDPTSTMDACAAAQVMLMGSTATLTCDAPTKLCVANVEIRLPYPVDLSMQSLPSQVVQYGADSVTIKKIAYWVMNTLNVDVPSIDFFVASAAAKDENDPSAVKIATTATLPAGKGCADAADPAGDSAAGSAAVCDVQMIPAGEAALATFVKNYQTPFEFIVHTKFQVKAGEPVPTGMIQLWMRPTVTFHVL